MNGQIAMEDDCADWPSFPNTTTDNNNNNTGKTDKKNTTKKTRTGKGINYPTGLGWVKARPFFA